jgi:hypothetical protein
LISKKNLTIIDTPGFVLKVDIYRMVASMMDTVAAASMVVSIA